MRSKKAGWLRVMSHLIDSRVSIIVPVYNTSIEYLRECTASVEAQTYSDIELIIVDDGSTDAGTVRFCDEYRNSKSTLIRKKNEGVSAARAAGLERACGSSVMFLDSDDRLEPHAVEHLVKVMDGEKADAVIAQDESGKNIPAISRYYGMDIMKALLDNREASFGWALWAKLFDTERMRQSYKVRKNIFYGEDLLVNADYFSKSDSAVVIDEKLYFYRKDNPDSAMAQARSVKKLSLIPMWREMADIYSAIGLEEEAQRIMANYYDSLLAGYLQCEYYRYDDYKRIMSELKTQLKAQLKCILGNDYVTGKYKYIIAVYFLWAFKLKRIIKNRG